MTVLLFASACTKEDNIQRYDLGTEFLVSVGGITSLDDNVSVSITNNEKNLSEIKVSLDDGSSLGTITVSDGSGSIVIPSTDLGVSDIDDKAGLQFDAAFDGKPIVRYGSLKVADPISVTDPGVMHKDTTYHFIYEVAPASATVTSVTVQTKVSEAGTYAPVTPVSGDLAVDSIALLGTDYAVGDTIFVEITAKTATKTAVTEAELVVAPDSYQSVGSFRLDNSYNDLFSPDDTLSYDMVLNKTVLVAEAADSADMHMHFAYADPTGGVDVRLYSENNMEFVEADGDAYANADILDVEATDFAGSSQNITVTEGDVYIYRTRRGTGAYSYGILKVMSVNVPVGADMMDATVDIEYKFTE